MTRWRRASRVTLAHRLEALGARLSVAVLQKLPPGMALGLGAALGECVWRFGVRRRVVLDNLAGARGLPDDPRRIATIARDTYRNLGRTMAEYARLPRLTVAQCAQLVSYDGAEHVKEAISGGRGVIALSGHFGSLELMALSFRSLGIRPTFIVAPMRNPLISRFLHEHRAALGIDLIEVGPSLRDAFRVLRRGGFLCMAGDQDAGRHGIPVEFLGRVASTPTGPVELAMRTGAPILWGVIFRQGGGGRHVVRVRPPVWIERRGSDEETIQHYVTLFARWLEEAILERPDHWFWLHRRWKTRLTPGERLPDTSRA